MPSPRKLGSLLYLLALAAILVRLPVVVTPFFDEDRAQLDYLLDDGGGGEATSHAYAFRGWWDLYRFLDGDSVATQRRIEAGVLPWRTDPLEKVAYWRPVASAAMALDAALFGTAALPAHGHSFLWFLALAASLLLLYRRLLPAGAAVVAWLAFLVSPASIYALQWWTARNALLAAFFAVWFLYFHLDWVGSRRRSRLLAALGCLALALLSAEAAAAVLAFALTQALVEGRPAGLSGLGRALTRLLPALLLAASWLLLRAALGYGVTRSALYADPFEEPAALLRLTLARFDRALGMTLLNQTTGNLLVLGALGAVLGVLVISYLRSRSEHRSTLTWMALGTLLALAPCFTSRNALRPWSMLIPQVGAHAMLGLLVAWGWDRGGRRWIRSTRGLLATFLAAAVLLVPLGDHLAAAGASRAMRRSRSLDSLATRFPEATRRALATGVDRIVFLESPWRILTPRRLVRWYGVELADPASVASLVVTDRAVGSTRVERADQARLAISADGGLLRRDDAFRFDRRYPLRPGFSVTGDGFEVTVEAMAGTATTAVRLQLDRSWDDPGVVVLGWDGAAFRVVEPPPVGVSVTLPR